MVLPLVQVIVIFFSAAALSFELIGGVGGVGGDVGVGGVGGGGGVGGVG